MEEIVKIATLSLARWIEAGAALVIALASAQAMWNFVLALTSSYRHTRYNRLGPSTMIPKEEIRLTLGRSLALALELELGADILKTAVAPNWNDVGLLVAHCHTPHCPQLLSGARTAQRRTTRPDSYSRSRGPQNIG